MSNSLRNMILQMSVYNLRKVQRHPEVIVWPNQTEFLWKQNRCLRYYDIDGSDFTELLETLNLGQYENIELSTRKFLIDYPELMKRYDLRDEYEIHNLLKRFMQKKKIRRWFSVVCPVCSSAYSIKTAQ